MYLCPTEPYFPLIEVATADQEAVLTAAIDPEPSALAWARQRIAYGSWSPESCAYHEYRYLTDLRTRNASSFSAEQGCFLIIAIAEGLLQP